MADEAPPDIRLDQPSLRRLRGNHPLAAKSRSLQSHQRQSSKKCLDLKKPTYAKEKFFRKKAYLGVDANQGIGSVEKLLLQRDQNKLRIVLRRVPDVRRHFSDISIVQSSVHFVKDKERRRLVAKNKKNNKQ